MLLATQSCLLEGLHHAAGHTELREPLQRATTQRGHYSEPLQRAITHTARGCKPACTHYVGHAQTVVGTASTKLGSDCPTSLHRRHVIKPLVPGTKITQTLADAQTQHSCPCLVVPTACVHTLFSFMPLHSPLFSAAASIMYMLHRSLLAARVAQKAPGTRACSCEHGACLSLSSATACHRQPRGQLQYTAPVHMPTSAHRCNHQMHIEG